MFKAVVDGGLVRCDGVLSWRKTVGRDENKTEKRLGGGFMFLHLTIATLWLLRLYRRKVSRGKQAFM